MPLPKDPKKAKEWKRKVGYKTMLGKKRSLKLIDQPTIKIKKNMTFEELEERDLLRVHAKLHQVFFEPPRFWNVEDVIRQHNNVAKEIEKRKLIHPSYDKEYESYELDEIYDFLEHTDDEEKKKYLEDIINEMRCIDE